MNVAFTLSEDFLAHLVAAGVLDEARSAEALDRQRTLAKPIGQLALQECVLTVKQVFEILAHQTDQGGLFGEIAMELGFMTESQLTRLLSTQRATRRTIGQVLLDLEFIDADVLETERRAYLQKLEPMLA